LGFAVKARDPLDRIKSDKQTPDLQELDRSSNQLGEPVIKKGSTENAVENLNDSRCHYPTTKRQNSRHGRLVGV
jgi:hypothetical protein